MNDALEIALGAAVPMRIMELERRGGPDDADRKEAGDFAQVLAEKGDVLLYGHQKPTAKNRGEVADLFNRTAQSIAVLAFCPGGIKLFGQTWKAGEKNR